MKPGGKSVDNIIVWVYDGPAKSHRRKSWSNNREEGFRVLAALAWGKSAWFYFFTNL